MTYELLETPIKAVENRQPDGTFGPGNNANPKGRPKGKSLKEFWRQRFADMSDEDKLAFTKKVAPEIIWKMGEGNPKNDVDLNAKVTIADVIKEIEDEGTFEQTLEDEQPLQDTGQKEEFDKVSAEQSSATLQSESVVEKFNS